ncbi:hypothetical protein L249_2049, partial [Ophiocordyceps polyrhachis-furcata BCC 54312]
MHHIIHDTTVSAKTICDQLSLGMEQGRRHDEVSTVSGVENPSALVAIPPAADVFWLHHGTMCNPVMSTLRSSHPSTVSYARLIKQQQMNAQDLYPDGIVRGTGAVFPTAFTPPAAISTPEELLTTGFGRWATERDVRIVSIDDQGQMFLLTHGTRVGRRPSPAAGWAFTFNYGMGGTVARRLETKGPFNDASSQITNRAQLRAAIAALRFRPWHLEGFTSLVIVTTSLYFYRGATERLPEWVEAGWRRRSDGSKVAHEDLWSVLLGEVERYNHRGLSVHFWRPPFFHSRITVAAAASAAQLPAADRFTDVTPVCIRHTTGAVSEGNNDMDTP